MSFPDQPWRQAALAFGQTFMTGVLLGAVILAGTVWLDTGNAIRPDGFVAIAALWLSGQIAVLVRHLLPAFSDN
jgi:hypothetical protein